MFGGKMPDSVAAHRNADQILPRLIGRKLFRDRLDLLQNHPLHQSIGPEFIGTALRQKNDRRHLFQILLDESLEHPRNKAFAPAFADAVQKNDQRQIFGALELLRQIYLKDVYLPKEFK